MASRKRAMLAPTEDWHQLQFQLDWPEQGKYELIRPVVVFGAPPVERARQTGVSVFADRMTNAEAWAELLFGGQATLNLSTGRLEFRLQEEPRAAS